MARTNDPYRILGVSRNADPGEIRRAFHCQVLRVHPDLHPADSASAERFKTVVRAYRQVVHRTRRFGTLQAGGFDSTVGVWIGGAPFVPRRRHASCNLPIRWKRAAGNFVAAHARSIPIVTALILSSLLTAIGLLSENAAQVMMTAPPILPPIQLSALLG